MHSAQSLLARSDASHTRPKGAGAACELRGGISADPNAGAMHVKVALHVTALVSSVEG